MQMFHYVMNIQGVWQAFKSFTLCFKKLQSAKTLNHKNSFHHKIACEPAVRLATHEQQSGYITSYQ